jgi:hypothetical protein
VRKPIRYKAKPLVILAAAFLLLGGPGAAVMVFGLIFGFLALWHAIGLPPIEPYAHHEVGGQGDHGHRVFFPLGLLSVLVLLAFAFPNWRGLLGCGTCNWALRNCADDSIGNTLRLPDYCMNRCSARLQPGGC